MPRTSSVDSNNLFFKDYNDGSYIRKVGCVGCAPSYIGKDSEDNIPWRNSQTYDYCSMPRSKVVVN
ncbi:hypothetical protein EG487_08225 [Paenibacillus polymyxa]|nr:hypothetical protein EG487_08225 [Paenibacillus polymyxa]